MMRGLLRKIALRTPTSSRLAALTAMVSLLLLAIAGFGAWQLGRLQLQSEQSLLANVRSIRAGLELDLHLQELRHQIDRAPWVQSPTASKEDVLKHLENLGNRREAIDRWMRQATDAVSMERQRQVLGRLEAGLNSFYEQIRIADSEVLDEANQWPAQLERIFEAEVLPPALEYLTLDEALLESSRNEASTQTRRLVKWLLVVGLLGAVAASTAGYGLARTISQSLVELRIPIEDVAGKLSEVTDPVVVSTEFDLSDAGPALSRVAREVTSIVEQLHARHREIIHADQLASVGQLAAGIAHEIRNPLTSMKMLVQSAQRQGAEQLTTRDLQVLDEEIRRLQSLLTEFLDFAKPKPLERTLLDVREVAEGTVAFLQNQADARYVAVEILAPAEPVMVWADPARLRQVLVNLIVNGVEMTPPGGSVRTSVRVVEHHESPYCRIEVADDGPGIDEEHGRRIFEPFYSTRETGLGLGLATSRRIVLLHGGELFLASGRPGSGATFVLLLPLPVGSSDGLASQMAVR